MDVKQVIETQIERLQELQASDPYWTVDTAREIREYIILAESFGLAGFYSNSPELTSDNGLDSVATCALVRELAGRDGVRQTVIDPYENSVLHIGGSAIVLTVVD